MPIVKEVSINVGIEWSRCHWSPLFITPAASYMNKTSDLKPIAGFWC